MNLLCCRILTVILTTIKNKRDQYLRASRKDFKGMAQPKAEVKYLYNYQVSIVFRESDCRLLCLGRATSSACSGCALTKGTMECVGPSYRAASAGDMNTFSKAHKREFCLPSWNPRCRLCKPSRLSFLTHEKHHYGLLAAHEAAGGSMERMTFLIDMKAFWWTG